MNFEKCQERGERPAFLKVYHEHDEQSYLYITYSVYLGLCVRHQRAIIYSNRAGVQLMLSKLLRSQRLLQAKNAAVLVPYVRYISRLMGF